MAKLDWDKARIENNIQRNGSERIRDESDRCFNSRVVKIVGSVLCPQCSQKIKRVNLAKHRRKAHVRPNKETVNVASKKHPKLPRIKPIESPKINGVRISDLAREVGVLPAIIVRRARLKGMDVDLPYHIISLELAERIRLELKRRA